MKKLTKHSVQWFYNILNRGECDIIDFKEALHDRLVFGKAHKNFSPKYDELAKDVVAFANYKGGFIIVGIRDKKHEINPEFQYDDQKTFKLISQIQNRTEPTLTLKPHKLKVEDHTLLILEIPFSKQVHRTSKGEYLIRSNDGNRAIEPHELTTILSEKGLIVYDQKVWKLNLSSREKDKNGNDVPGWLDINRTRKLYEKIDNEKPNSSHLKSSMDEFNENLGLTKEEDGQNFPTTTGLLFIGSQRALRELPFNQIKYIRYQEDGSYTPYEFTGDLITIADKCYEQLKSEINYQEFTYGLFRTYIADFPEIVLRELLINALAHRDYSKHSVIEIRKWPNLIEFESPGTFPEGVNKDNMLRKSNSRNPNIMDVFREINYAEKAGSGFDKIFRSLLESGKDFLEPEENESSLIFRVRGETLSPKLVNLSHEYKSLKGRDIDLESLLVLNMILSHKKLTLNELSDSPLINKNQIRNILRELEDIEFIESSGRTSALKFHLHKSKLSDYKDRKIYLKQKKQDKAKQKEAVLRYLNEFGEIDNENLRKHLSLPDNQIYYASRLIKEMKNDGLIKLKKKRGKKYIYEKT